MTLVIDLAPEIEHRLGLEAARRGQQPAEFITQLLRRELEPKEFNLDALLSLPRQEQERIMRVSFDAAASHYDADIALPAEQRELTAFTALDGDEFADGG